jgi:hypothetical protein
MLRLSRPSPATVLAMIAVVIALGGVGVAAIPDTTGVIHTCYDPTTGALRVGDPAGGPPRPCQPATEKLLDIDTTPPAGPRGPAGPPGSAVLQQSSEPKLSELPMSLKARGSKLSRKRRRTLARKGKQGEPTRGFEVFRDGSFNLAGPTDPVATVARLELPAGRYYLRVVGKPQPCIAAITMAIAAVYDTLTKIFEKEKETGSCDVSFSRLIKLGEPAAIEFRAVVSSGKAQMRAVRLTAINVASASSRPTKVIKCKNCP